MGEDRVDDIGLGRLDEADDLHRGPAAGALEGIDLPDRKALEIDPGFVASYVGIGNNRIFKGQPEEARKTLKKLFDRARDRYLALSSLAARA